jgi:hypothetical protein
MEIFIENKIKRKIASNRVTHKSSNFKFESDSKGRIDAFKLFQKVHGNPNHPFYFII